MRDSAHSDHFAVSESRATGTAHRSAVQRKSRNREARLESMAGGVQGVAAQGTSGGGGSLPHLDRIQSAFGSHDVSGVQSHVGGPAAAASDQLGAQAYASGNHVAFKESPSLHTAAHEAAHVVQQRGGVQLKSGLDTPGDAYERHADAVADAVVAGRDAGALLDAVPGGGGGGAQVQRNNGNNGDDERPDGPKLLDPAERRRIFAAEADRILQDLDTQRKPGQPAPADPRAPVPFERPLPSLRELASPTKGSSSNPTQSNSASQEAPPTPRELLARLRAERQQNLAGVGPSDPSWRDKVTDDTPRVRVASRPEIDALLQNNAMTSRRLNVVLHMPPGPERSKFLAAELRENFDIGPSGGLVPKAQRGAFSGGGSSAAVPTSAWGPADGYMGRLGAEPPTPGEGEPHQTDRPRAPVEQSDSVLIVFKNGVATTATHNNSTNETEYSIPLGYSLADVQCIADIQSNKYIYGHPPDIGKPNQTTPALGEVEPNQAAPARVDPAQGPEAPESKRQAAGDDGAVKAKPHPESPDAEGPAKMKPPHEASDAEGPAKVKPPHEAADVEGPAKAKPPAQPDAEEAKTHPKPKSQPDAEEAHAAAKTKPQPDAGAPEAAKPAAEAEGRGAPAAAKPLAGGAEALSPAKPAPPAEAPHANAAPAKPTQKPAPPATAVTSASPDAPPPARVPEVEPAGRPVVATPKRDGDEPAAGTKSNVSQPEDGAAPLKPKPSNAQDADGAAAKPKGAKSDGEASESATPGKGSNQLYNLFHKPDSKNPSKSGAHGEGAHDSHPASTTPRHAEPHEGGEHGSGGKGSKKPSKTSGGITVEVTGDGITEVSVDVNHNLARIDKPIPILGVAGGGAQAKVGAGVYANIGAGVSGYAKGSLKLPKDGPNEGIVEGGLNCDATASLKAGVEFTYGKANAEATIDVTGTIRFDPHISFRVWDGGGGWKVVPKGLQADLSASVSAGATVSAGYGAFKVGGHHSFFSKTLPLVHIEYPSKGDVVTVSEEAKQLGTKISQGISGMTNAFKDAAKATLDALGEVGGLPSETKIDAGIKEGSESGTSNGESSWETVERKIGYTPSLKRYMTPDEVKQFEHLRQQYVGHFTNYGANAGWREGLSDAERTAQHTQFFQAQERTKEQVRALLKKPKRRMAQEEEQRAAVPGLKDMWRGQISYLMKKPIDDAISKMWAAAEKKGKAGVPRPTINEAGTNKAVVASQAAKKKAQAFLQSIPGFSDTDTEKLSAAGIRCQNELSKAIEYINNVTKAVTAIRSSP